jgi:hypothetical protein
MPNPLERLGIADVVKSKATIPNTHIVSELGHLSALLGVSARPRP